MSIRKRDTNLARVDGVLGALCEMTPVTDETMADVIRKLKRFTEWSEHFGIETWAPTIIKIIERGGLAKQVILGKETLLGAFK